MEKNKKKNNIINFPRKKSKLERQIEAIIFSAEEPLDIETIEKRVGSTSNIKKILENLRKEYSERGRKTSKKRKNKEKTKTGSIFDRHWYHHCFICNCNHLSGLSI